MPVKVVIITFLLITVFSALYYIAFGIGLPVPINPCAQLTGEKWVGADVSVSFSELCAHFTAKIFSNPNICLDKSGNDGCMGEIAVKNESEETCAQMTEEYSRQWCYLKLADKTKNPDLCFKSDLWEIVEGYCWDILVGDFNNDGSHRFAGIIDETDDACLKGGRFCRVRMGDAWIIVADRVLDSKTTSNLDYMYDTVGFKGIHFDSQTIHEKKGILAKYTDKNLYTMYGYVQEYRDLDDK